MMVRVALACVAMAGLSLAGCDAGGPPMGQVTGLVTLDGKPLPNAAVTFAPVDGGGPSSGITDASGNYELNAQDRKGALIGKHKVSVTSVVMNQSAVDPNMSSSSPEYAKQAQGGGAGEYNIKQTEPIPAKYNEKSELEYEVKSGSNKIDLELKSS